MKVSALDFLLVSLVVAHETTYAFQLPSSSSHLTTQWGTSLSRPSWMTSRSHSPSWGQPRNEYASPTTLVTLSGRGMMTSITSSFSSPLFATPGNVRSSGDSSNNSPYDETCDVLVLGSGPAARAIASLLSSETTAAKAGGEGAQQQQLQRGLDVIVADRNFDKAWPPNYGVWMDEWDAIVNLYQNDFNIQLGPNVIDRYWEVTDCYFGGSFDIPTEQRFRIDRPYQRIDRDALRMALSPPSETSENQKNDSDQNDQIDGRPSYRVLRANHISKAINVNLYSPPGSLVHDDEGTSIVLRSSDGTERTVRTRLVIDCTGHESKLTLKDARIRSRPPGFQIAFGALVEVDETSISSDQTRIGPYDMEAMTLFDYRTDHFQDDSVELRKAQRAPTFMYVMPLKGNRIFFEETSLVARPALSFQDCKDRCFQRLQHLGIKVTKIEEEEFCYIPMGGPLPQRDQRIIGFGGASAMVHPSTGYHLCRAMMGAGAVAKTIRSGLLSESSNQLQEVNLDRVAAEAYHSIWSPSNTRQRNFAVFGGEFLMKQNVEGLRGFFDGFFRLPLELWGGFLAGWPGLPNNTNHETWYARLWFGLTFVSKLPLPVALDMLASILTYSIAEGTVLLQSVTPFFGEPESYELVEKELNVGDVAAKNEARRMIAESKVTEEVPISFHVDGLGSAEIDTNDAVGEDLMSSSSSPLETDGEEATTVGTFL